MPAIKGSARKFIFSFLVLALVACALIPMGCAGTKVSEGPATVHWIELSEVQNARDLGGWTMRDGSKVPYVRVFRTGKLSKASDEDLAALRKLGIRTSIDLRTRIELTASGKDPSGPNGIPASINVPMLGVVSAAGYRDIVKNQKPALARVFTALASGATYPVIVHCAGGKDRTGIVSALLLDLLGVSRPQIIQDYMLSEDTGEVDQAWIKAALAEVDAEGGIEKYLTGIGIDPSMQSAIKKEIIGR